MYLNERKRVELGIPLDIMSRTMEPLKEFCKSDTGILVASLMAKASGEVLGGLTNREQRKLIMRTRRETGTMLHALTLGPSETHLDNLQTFNAACAVSYEIMKLGKLPTTGKIGYRQYMTFLENLVAPNDNNLSVLGESINDALIRSSGHAMLGVAMSNGYYGY